MACLQHCAEHGEPIGTPAEAVTSTFGGVDQLRAIMTDVGFKRFSSGWGWLVLDKHKKLAIADRPNQDSPTMDGLAPLLGVDVWEHAHYLHYRNVRADYLKVWWNIVN